MGQTGYGYGPTAGQTTPLGIAGRYNTGTLANGSWAPGGVNNQYLQYAPKDAQGNYIYDQSFHIPGVGYRAIPRPQLQAPGTVNSGAGAPAGNMVANPGATPLATPNAMYQGAGIGAQPGQTIGDRQNAWVQNRLNSGLYR
jgi:hypothetical protein